MATNNIQDPNPAANGGFVAGAKSAYSNFMNNSLSVAQIKQNWEQAPEWQKKVAKVAGVGATVAGTVLAAPAWVPTSLALAGVSYLGWKRVPSQTKKRIETKAVEFYRDKPRVKVALTWAQKTVSDVKNIGSVFLQTDPEKADPKLIDIQDEASTIIQRYEAQGDGSRAAPPEQVLLPHIQAIKNDIKVTEPSSIKKVELEAEDPIGAKEVESNKDWKAETELHLQNLSVKLSYLGAFYSTLWWLHKGPGEFRPDKTKLLQLVAIAYEQSPDGKAPIWKLFREHYELRWTDGSYWKAAVFYFFTTYFTSVIPNTIDTFLKAFIHEARDQLTQQNSGQTLNFVVSEILHNANQFFHSYNNAARVFATKKQSLTDSVLDDHRREAIELHYNKSLETLCQNFSQVLVDRFAKKEVPFFQRVKAFPVLGKIFQYPPFSWPLSLTQWGLNKIIRYVVKTWILPSVLQSAIKGGVDSADKSNLLFGNALTTFFAEQFAKLRDTLKNTKSGPAAGDNPPIEEQQKLRAVVEELKFALDLAPFETTQIRLRAKLDELEKGGKATFVDKEVEDGIKNGITDVCNFLFNYLKDPCNTDKVFANLLDLANTPFSGEIPKKPEEWNKFTESYQKKKDVLKIAARDVFEKIVTNATNQVVNATPKHSVETIDQTFEEHMGRAHGTVGDLESLCTQMSEKIRTFTEDQSEATIQAELASCAVVLRAFSDQERIQNQLESKELEKNMAAIECALNPLYDKALLILKRINQLQDLQTKFSGFKTLNQQLGKIEQLLPQIHSHLLQQPEQALALIQDLQLAQDEIAKVLPPSAKVVPPYLRDTIPRISKTAELIRTEKKTLDALSQLDHLLLSYAQYKKGTPPPGFTQKQALSQIKQKCRMLPALEARAVETQIDRIIKVPAGSTFTREWEKLASLIRQVNQATEASHTNHLIELLGTNENPHGLIQNFENWVREKKTIYEKRKQDTYAFMNQEMQMTAREVAELQEQARSVQTDPHLHLTTDQRKLIASVVGFIPALSLPYIPVVSSFFTTAVTATGAASLGTLLYLGFKNYKRWHGTSRSDKVKATADAILKAGFNGAAIFVIDYITSLGGKAFSTLASGAVGAIAASQVTETLTKTSVEVIKTRATDEVMKIFENAYDLVLSPHIYHAATTRFMTSVIGSRPAPAQNGQTAG